MEPNADVVHYSEDICMNAVSFSVIEAHNIERIALVNPLKTAVRLNISIWIQFVPHREHCVSITKTNRLMFREVSVGCSENHTKYI